MRRGFDRDQDFESPPKRFKRENDQRSSRFEDYNRDDDNGFRRVKEEPDENGYRRVKQERDYSNDDYRMNQDNFRNNQTNYHRGEEDYHRRVKLERDSSTSNSNNHITNMNNNNNNATNGNHKQSSKPSRWNNADNTKSIIPGIPHLIPSALTENELEALLLRARIDEITHHLKIPSLLDSIPRRSPSPPPIYDNQTGKRTNTREHRLRTKLERERHMLIERVKTINPAFKPPADYKPVSSKINLKIRIPIDKHPTYNFIGLILGPRGQTQKEMEKKTNTKISIRGKGAVKNEAKRRYANPDDHEDLHVLITGDSEKGVKEAAKLVHELLVPVDDDSNEHKWKQLEMLAEMNGTKTGNWRTKRKDRNYDDHHKQVSCSFCGEGSHPTSDCPSKDKPGAVSKFDLEYQKLMSQIGDNPHGEEGQRDVGGQNLGYGGEGGHAARGNGYGGGWNTTVEQGYADFMSLLNNIPEGGNGGNNSMGNGQYEGQW
eukprot:TRINITY_DN6827_c0_g1_i1.p1 TRINITY_DN6827_c0_g1~~TRINITY_DN6827_c0_g1_i1.p1  ORF type:complete len:488 (-),score=127.00 TRINITY_DN6827_c0_g1_i1:25-1488(-)